MIKTEIKTATFEEMQEIERKLILTGYKKESSCYWAKIFTKGNNEIILTIA